MTYSILHISDLHRSPDDPVDNATLLSGLQADFDRWGRESPNLPQPQAIVVSGDLVRGVRIGQFDYERILDEQYQVATDFLTRLTDDVVRCNRSDVVIVPGNHDVDWNRARAAMVPVEPDELPSDLSAADFHPNEPLRWNWTEQRAYRIVDQGLYASRLERFERLADDFYRVPHSFRTGTYYRVSSLDNGRIGVAGFNSCHVNDCYSRVGSIPDSAIGNAHMDLRLGGHELLLGVWHHSVDGGPLLDDYMDVETVYGLIGRGWRVGLHGHQHKAQAGHRYIQLPEQERMALISAGSLCAGQRELPKGVNRQFNLVVFDDDLASATVHLREIAVGSIFGPSRRLEFGGNSYVGLSWSLPDRSASRSSRQRVLQAEEASKNGRHDEAIDLLVGLDLAADSFPDGIAMSAIREGSLWHRAAELYPEPDSVGRLILRVIALLEMKQPAEAVSLLDEYGPRLGLQKATDRDLRDRAAAIRRVAGE